MLNIKVLAGKNYGPTSRLIRNCLQKFQPIENNASRGKIWITKSASNVWGIDYVVRWGNISPLGYSPKLEVNSAEFVRLCGKKTFSNFMQDYSIKNLSVVEFEVMSKIPEEFPVILRKTLAGYQGKGIKILSTAKEFEDNINPKFHWSKVLKADAEFRVHVLGGKVKRIFKKIPKSDTIENVEIPIRNSKDYRYSLRSDSNEFTRMLRIIEEVSEVLPHAKNSFFAADVGLCYDSGGYIIYEINTAPGLNTPSAEIYARWLWEKFQEAEKTLE